MTKKPTLAVIAGGGCRQIEAATGVLQAMEAAGIKIDLYRGCSAGACVAALHASGVDGNALETIIRKTPAKKIFRVCWRHQIAALFGANIRHVFDGSGLFDLLKKYMTGAAREKVTVALSILPRYAPMLAEATPVTVYGSAAIPELLEPVEIGPYLCCDGGVRNLIPTPKKLDRSKYGRIYIILSPHNEPGKPPQTRIGRAIAAILATMDREECEVVDAWEAEPDVTVLQPPPFTSGLFSWSKGYKLIEHARNYAEKKLKGDYEKQNR